MSDQERARFEKHALSVGLSITRTPQALCFANGVRMAVGDYFEPTRTAYAFWLAAKHDAKPIADVFKVQCFGDNKYTYSGGHGTFATREDAEAHAVANGFRLE